MEIIGDSPDSDETFMKRGFKACYGIILKLGCCYIVEEKTGRDYLVWNLYYFSLLAPFLSSYVFELEAILVSQNQAARPNLAQFFTMMNYVIFCIINCSRSRHYIDKIFLTVGKGFFTYSSPDYEIEQVKLKYLKLNKIFVYFWVVGLFLIQWVINGGSLLTAYYTDFSNYTDGINYFLMVPIKYPVDTTGVYRTILGNLFELVAEFLFIFVFFAQGICFATVSAHICANLEALSLSIEKIQIRARLATISKGGTVDSPLFVQEYEKCLIENLKHHIEIINCFNNFQDWTSPMILVVFYIGAFLICVSGIILTDGGLVITGVKLSTAFILVAEIVYVFMYCFLADTITSLGADVGDSLYNIDWYDRITPNTKAIIFTMMERCKSPLALSAANILYINLPTFSQILSSSYSYFNVLGAINQQA